MKILVTIFLLCGWARAQEDVVTPEAVTATEIACGLCPQVTVQHYGAKSCTPVVDREMNPCCPVAYDCPSSDMYGNTASQCMYKNRTYSVGSPVPVEGPCRTDCKCSKPIGTGFTAEIVCANIECPQSNIDLKPGCRLIHDVNQCCAVDIECNEVFAEETIVEDTNVQLREPDCTVDGFNFFAGDVMVHASHPCQHCVCSKNFTGPYGPGCVTVDCGLDYKFSDNLRRGCVPLYSIGTCCPTDWVCPDGEFVIDIPNPAHANSTDMQCQLGSITAPAGFAVATYSCTVNCICNTPPDFTCVEYPTCEMALQAQHAGILP